MAWFLYLHFRHRQLYSISEGAGTAMQPLVVEHVMCCNWTKSCPLPNNEEQLEGVCMPKLGTKVVLYATATEQVGDKQQFIFEPKRLRIATSCICGSKEDKYYYDYELKNRVVPERTTTPATTTTTATATTTTNMTTSSGHTASSVLASPILLVPLFLLHAENFLSSFKQWWFRESNYIAEFLSVSACLSVILDYYLMIYCFNLLANVFL